MGKISALIQKPQRQGPKAASVTGYSSDEDQEIDVVTHDSEDVFESFVKSFGLLVGFHSSSKLIQSKLKSVKKKT